MRKVVVCIADGMGDIPASGPDGRTPLEAASTPVLDSMTRHGVAGLCYTIPRGFDPDSDVGNMALLGYAPERYHTGRGPIEALSLDITPAADDLIWRLSLTNATGLGTDDSILSAGATELGCEEGPRLIRAMQHLFGGEDYTFYANEWYRHILVQHRAEAEQIALPPLPGPQSMLKQPMGAALGRYTPRIRLLMEALHTFLNSQSKTANLAWVWGQGRPLCLPSFEQQHKRRGCLVTGVSLLRGLARAASLELFAWPEFTGRADTDLRAKAAAASNFLQMGGDVAFVHVEAPDCCGHDGDYAGKKAAIERIDGELLAPLYRAFPDAVFLVTCDHFTPVSTGAHHPGPVPYLITHPSLPDSGIPRMTEGYCQAGALVTSGPALLEKVLSIVP